MRKVWLGPELHALDLMSRCLLALTRICNCTYNTYRVSTCLWTKGTQNQSLFASSASAPSRPSRRRGGGVERQTTVMQEYRVRGGVSLSARKPRLQLCATFAFPHATFLRRESLFESRLARHNNTQIFLKLCRVWKLLILAQFIQIFPSPTI
jgi:hypothetical protein